MYVNQSNWINYRGRKVADDEEYGAVDLWVIGRVLQGAMQKSDMEKEKSNPTIRAKM